MTERNEKREQGPPERYFTTNGNFLFMERHRKRTSRAKQVGHITTPFHCFTFSLSANPLFHFHNIAKYILHLYIYLYTSNSKFNYTLQYFFPSCNLTFFIFLFLKLIYFSYFKMYLF